MKFKVGDRVYWTYDGSSENVGTIVFKSVTGLYLIEHKCYMEVYAELSAYGNTYKKRQGYHYIWINPNKKDKSLKYAIIPDTKLARKLYKNQIKRIEDGKIYF